MNTTSSRTRMLARAGTLVSVVTIAAMSACADTSGLPRTPAGCRQIAAQVHDNLEQQIVRQWYPRAVDREHGGFYETYTEDWQRPAGDPNVKSVVYQSRLTWVAAQMSQRDKTNGASYADYTRHGVACLSNLLWDKQDGGFFWDVTQDGKPEADRGTEKHAYGISFAIYASAAAYRATQDPAALDLAKRAFLWLDQHGHDAEHGGYYEAFRRDGSRILAADAGVSIRAGNDPIGTRYGYKSMNTHIHLLESFTALYEVWPDPLLHKRLQEIFDIVRDKIAVGPAGCMNLFFLPDWRAVPDHDSFGHDVETAYLLTESAAVLGKPNDEKTWTVARNLVDHALSFGWDDKNAGFYDTGSAFEAPTGLDKVWWTEAEGLNALLLMSDRYDSGDNHPYWNAFLRQWEFIQTHQVDAKNGGWFKTVSPDGSRIPGLTKSDAWTDPYHQGRALMNVEDRLLRMADRLDGHGAAVK